MAQNIIEDEGVSDTFANENCITRNLSNILLFVYIYIEYIYRNNIFNIFMEYHY